ncbi:MAG: Arc family DNA-binding protein [Elusimicrobia bacterium]|nr:Arc family DNA-binding protein [Elusimicrobiota bacterium]MBU2615171.1 Arc family DNA-binding protein [Elusimicrobiota bacterium]
MSSITTIRLPDNVRKKVALRAKMEHRSVSNLIEKCIETALIAEDNPDLPLVFIRDILEAKSEKEHGLAKPFSL